MVEFGLFTIAQGIANLLAMVCSNPLNEKALQKLRFIVQDVTLPVICVIIFLVLVYLELTMPTWETIYQSTNYQLCNERREHRLRCSRLSLCSRCAFRAGNARRPAALSRIAAAVAPRRDFQSPILKNSVNRAIIHHSELNIVKRLQRTGVRPRGWVKRESGGNPERCRHCVWETLSIVTGKPGRGERR